MKILACTTVLFAMGPILAQPRPGPTVDWSKVEDRIQWFGSWKGAKEAARRSGRPILLVSAAPHCHNISGIW